MWPLTPQERRTVFFVGFVFLIGITIKLLFWSVPRAQASLTVLDSNGYHPKININRAGYHELLTVPHLGASSAARIINYRQKHGCIRTPAELVRILKKKPQSAHSLAGFFQWP